MVASSIAALALMLSAAEPAETYRDSQGRTWAVAGRTVDSVVLRHGRTRIELHSTCRTTSRSYGNGRWEWANGGFLVIAGNRRIGFPRQEINAGQGSSCQS